jgi:hypothetical protein
LTGGGILLSSSGAVLTKVLASFAVVGKVTNATLQKLNINIYKGTQYAGASLVLSKSVLVNTLSAQSLLASTDPAISLDAGQLLYIDIAYAVQPTTRPKGLLVSFTYVPL